MISLTSIMSICKHCILCNTSSRTKKYYQMGNGGLSKEEVQDLREWTFELDVEEEDLLTRY